MKRLFILIFLVLFFAGCDKKVDNALITTENTEMFTDSCIVEIPTETTTIDNIQEQLDTMSLDEKIGQMLFVAYRSDSNGNKITEGNEFIKNEINKYNPGGFILFSENLISVEQTKQLINFYKNNSKIKPYIGIDEEGGAVSRLGNSGIIKNYKIPPARTMTKGGKQSVVDNYTTISKNLATLGFNLDFAPVADVDTNPENPIIGNRSFSTEADEVAEMMLVAMQTMKTNGITPVVKHFPGHGDTKNDSHKGLTIMLHNMDRLEEIELVPFKKAIENNADFIMVAHLTTPSISDNDLPASLNADIVTDLLRNKLGYNGIIISDAMDMGAITTLYGCGDAAVTAVNAGVDIILMPQSVSEAFDSIKNAVSDGRISTDKIDKAVYRILKAKENLL